MRTLPANGLFRNTSSGTTPTPTPNSTILTIASFPVTCTYICGCIFFALNQLSTRILANPVSDNTIGTVDQSISLLFISGTTLSLLGAINNSGVLAIFFFNDSATTEIYTLSLHDALPI